MTFQTKNEFVFFKIILFVFSFITFLGGINSNISSVAWAKATSKSSSVEMPYDLSDSPKYAAIVIDAKTGMVLSQDNADRTLHPASLTKMMTMLLVFEALDQGKIRSSSKLVASSNSSNAPPSRAGLKPGEGITVYEALRTMATKSANDVAVTVAENLGGSEQRFAQMMNLKARELGMNNTNFVNASGLHDNRQITSARDMSKLAKYLIDRYPQYYPVFGLRSYQFRGKNFQNHNHLMKTYVGMDGIKTGYVAASGFNLVASAKRKGIRLIGVVMGGPSTNIRNNQMAALLDQGFVKYSQLSATGYYANGRYAEMELQPVKKPLAGTGNKVTPPIPPSKPVTYGQNYGASSQNSLTKAGVLTLAGAQAQEVSNDSAQKKSIVSAENIIDSQPVPIPSTKPELNLEDGRKTRTTSPTSNQPELSKRYPVSPTYLKLPEKYVDKQTVQNQNFASSSNLQGHAVPNNRQWQVQIGAYTDQPSARDSLAQTISILPSSLRNVSPLVIPLRTADARWIYRGRLKGYSQQEALAACEHLKSQLKDCLPIAPPR